MSRILLVGDESWSLPIAQALRAVGYEVAQLQDAIEAVQLALEDPPAAVVSQLTLRGASGPQLCRLLQAEVAQGEIPVIIFSPEGELGAAFRARTAGAAAHVRDTVALLDALPAIVARPQLPPSTRRVDRASLVGKLSQVLDRALHDGELAAEVRALASSEDVESMFDGLVALASQVLPYAWLGLAVGGESPRFLLHAGADYETDEREARKALGLDSSAVCVRAARVIAASSLGREPLEVPIFFGDSQVGQLAVALPRGHEKGAKMAAALVAYELGGPLKIMTLLEQVQLQARTDTLTNLLNRRAFLELAAREQARSARHKLPISVLVLDIDHFKRVNDTHGHPAGDAVLQGVGRALMAAARKADVVCRWGGEEFAIALPQTDLSGALVAAERMRQRIEQATHALPDGTILKVTASIGVSSAPAPWSIEDVIAAADDALYEAKRAGRNRVCSKAG